MNIDPRQCWRTPPDFWKAVNDVFQFDIDCAADGKSALCETWIGPDHYAIPERDFFKKSWQPYEGADGKCRWQNRYRGYTNPGFNGFAQWLPRVIEVMPYFQVNVIMCHVATGAEWWQKYAIQAQEIIFLTPRVQFVAPPGIPQSSNARDNALLVYRSDVVGNGGPIYKNWRWK